MGKNNSFGRLRQIHIMPKKKVSQSFFGPESFLNFSRNLFVMFFRSRPWLYALKSECFWFWMKILTPNMGEIGHFGPGSTLLLRTCSFAFLVAFWLKSTFTSQICHMLFGIFWWKVFFLSQHQKNVISRPRCLNNKTKLLHLTKFVGWFW